MENIKKKYKIKKYIKKLIKNVILQIRKVTLNTL